VRVLQGAANGGSCAGFWRSQLKILTIKLAQNAANRPEVPLPEIIRPFGVYIGIYPNDLNVRAEFLPQLSRHSKGQSSCAIPVDIFQNISAVNAGSRTIGN
jgi:hypothetical protein